jgi:hypothetical protein
MYVLFVPLGFPACAVTVIVIALLVAPGATVTWTGVNADGHAKSVQSESNATSTNIWLLQAAVSLFFIEHV